MDDYLRNARERGKSNDALHSKSRVRAACQEHVPCAVSRGEKHVERECDTVLSPLAATSPIISCQTFSETCPTPPKISLISLMVILPLPS